MKTQRFLTTPTFIKEVVNHVKENYGIDFTSEVSSHETFRFTFDMKGEMKAFLETESHKLTIVINSDLFAYLYPKNSQKDIAEYVYMPSTQQFAIYEYNS